MRTIIKGKVVKAVMLVTLASLCSLTYADYYFSPPGVVFSSGCSTPCCGSPCGQRVVTGQRIYSPPVKKVKFFRHNRARGNYSSVTAYYVWPTFAGAVWAPSCGGGCAQPVATYCDAWSCPGFFVPPEYYTSVTNSDMFDERTADDF